MSEPAKPPRRARALRVVPAPEPQDPLVQAILANAKAMNAIATAIRANTKQRKPADEFFAGASHRLDAVCGFLRKYGKPILVSIPGVLMAVGAITPKLGAALGRALDALGLGVGH